MKDNSVLKFAIFIAGITFFLLYLFVIAQRLAYPYELEWLEGLSLQSVDRILAGESLYVEPSFDFVSPIYTPLYFYVSASFASIMGLGFAPLRLVSVIASIFSLLLVFAFIRKETNNSFYAFLGTSLFIATYARSGAWLDLARVDSLFLALLLGAFFVAKFYNSPLSRIELGILVSLAFLTKQTAIIMVAPLLLYLMYREKWRSLYFIVPIAIIIAGSALFMNNLTEGWYQYYTFTLPSQHGFAPTVFYSFWLKDILLYVPLLALLALAYVSNKNANNRYFYAALLSGVLLGSWYAKLKLGGFVNNLIPSYAVLSIVAALAAYSMLQHLEFPRLLRGGFSSTLIYSLILLQFIWFAYNPYSYIPSQEDWGAGNRIVAFVENLKGDVLIPSHPYIASMAGKTAYAHFGPLYDVLIGADSKTSQDLKAEVISEISSKKFEYIIIDSDPDVEWFPEELEKSYMLKETIPYKDRSTFRPKVSVQGRPELVYMPK